MRREPTVNGLEAETALMLGLGEPEARSEGRVSSRGGGKSPGFCNERLCSSLMAVSRSCVAMAICDPTSGRSSWTCYMESVPVNGDRPV